MAGHHDAGVHIGSLQALLLAETDRLVSSIVIVGGDGVHAATVEAVGDFLTRFSGEGGRIPWARLYDCFPSWQQQSGLLIESWDRDEDLQKAKVIFTLITAERGGAINRKALGAQGTWEIKSGGKIGHDVLIRKLYFKSGVSLKRFTSFEFHLRMDLKPRVAICVLHRTDYRHTIRDLRNYVREGDFPGRNQANLQVEQYQDPPCDAGFMNGEHVDHTTIPASKSERNILGANQVDQMAMLHEEQYLVHNVPGFRNDTQFNYTADPVSNSEMIYGQPSIHSSQEAPPPQASLDDLSQFLFSEDISMPEPGGQHSHADEMSTFDDFHNLLWT